MNRQEPKMSGNQFDILSIIGVERERADEIYDAVSDEFRKEDGSMVDVLKAGWDIARSPGEYFIAGMAYQRIRAKNLKNKRNLQALIKEMFDE